MKMTTEKAMQCAQQQRIEDRESAFELKVRRQMDLIEDLSRQLREAKDYLKSLEYVAPADITLD